jgi:uncharacterized membrane protein YccC
MGAICVGFASQQGVYRTRAAAMLLTASAMALSTLVGGLAAYSLPALVIVTALWGYAYGIIASLGPAATTVGINSVIALVVFSHFQLSFPMVVGEALLVLAGGLVQTLLLVSVWPLRRFSTERRSLAGACRSLSAYARTIASGRPELPAAAPIATVRQTLADPQPFARRGDIAAFQALLDETERVRASLVALASDRARTSQTRAIDDLVLAAAELLDDLAAALEAAREPIDSRGDWQRFSDAEARIEAASSADVHVRGDAHALAGQLRSAWRIATYPADVPSERKTDPEASVRFPSLEDTVATLRANLSLRSPYGRLAPRLAGTLAIATILGGIVPSQHGYWIAMTAVILLRPDFTTTFLRGIGRVGGTLLGAVLATVIASHVRPGAETYVALCIFFAGFAYAVFKANYALFTVAITAYVGFLLALTGQTEQTAVIDRVVATVLAGLLAGFAVLVWPTWEAGRVRTALADLLDANRRYARRVFDAYIDPDRHDARAIAGAQTTAWTLRSDAEASLDRMLGEPRRTHGISEEAALGILAASRRVGFAILSLNAHYAHAEHRKRPGLEPFANALDDGLRASIEGLRENRAPAAYAHLREAYRALEEALKASSDRDAAMLLSESDALVDAVNTIAELVRSS